MFNKYIKNEFKQLWSCHLDDIVRLGKSKYKVVVSPKSKWRNALQNIKNGKVIERDAFTYVEILQ